jgi:protein NUD1
VRFQPLWVVIILTAVEASADLSPTKTGSSTGRPSTDEIQPLAPRRPTAFTSTAPNNEGSSRRTLSRTHSRKPPSSVANNVANVTFLTECSFGVAHDRLVQILTDVQPFEPYWEELSSLDISGKNVDSVARLKEFMPKLDSLCLYVSHYFLRLSFMFADFQKE